MGDYDGYKAKTINDVKRHLQVYIAQFNERGKCECEMVNVGGDNGSKVKIIKGILIIWISVVAAVISTVIYIEFIAKFFSISLFEYLSVLFLLLCILVTGVIISAKTKRVRKLTFTSDYIKVLTQKGDEYVFDFDVSKIKFKRLRNRKHRVKRRCNFFLKVSGCEKRQKFILRAESNQAFGAFLIFISSILGNFETRDLTDEQLYKMYQKNRNGIKIAETR